MPFLVVGLGNPGSQYARTRHNAGFWVLDRLVNRWNLPRDPQKKHKGLLWETSRNNEKVLLLAPQTFMNLSGESIQTAAHFFKVDSATQCLVITDDLDLPPGKIRIRTTGGAGGHNGLKSAIQCLGTEDFLRMRIGIGRVASIPADRYVLMPISGSDVEFYEPVVEKAAQAVETFLDHGIEKAMEQFNRKEGTDGP